jgi:simple sugar transport system permease protein
MTASQSEHIRQAIAARRQRWVFAKIADWIRDKPEGGITVMFVIVQLACIIGALMYPDSFRYLSAANLSVTLKAIAPLGIMALGVGVLMIAGEYDLSVGALYSFCAIICATMSNTIFGGSDTALAPFLGLAVGLAVGALAGMFNAFITLRFAIPSFITTLGAMLLWKGGTLLYHGASALRFQPSEPFSTLFSGESGFIYAGTIWFLLLAVAFYFLLHHHRLGNHFYAVGGNLNAAIAIGIRPARVKTIAFALAGATAAFAGIIAATRVGSVQPGGGLGLELQAIAACVIGGMALTGGRGSILGVVLGTMLIFTIKDVLLLLQAPGFYFDMFVGALIVFSVVLNTFIRRTKA